ncbi:AfsR/SARP family transcriptional regulator [Lentzea aerocolonigenes]|uniref:AfsR/SARP family transcriptional regulator n=1 Tax=Lentzea aerocolonigenes TaxID=68170 RepID=UPI0009DF1107|nr:BTAD domain-containing putative transcriptional regulator [Lentzea aerocolonigenes]MCP2247401.1 DNA-binding transcriptional activator of the SARP family [Lentzea aerocolonigenes]
MSGGHEEAVGVSVLVRLLGEFSAEADGQPVDLGTPRQRCVLAALAVDAGRVVPVDRVVERVWGADAEPRTRSTLHNYISRLRRALSGPDGVTIVRRSGGYALSEPVTDLHRFRDLRAAADAEADDEQTAQLLTRALQLWRGHALTGVHGEWAEAEGDRLEQERLAAQHELTTVRLRLGQGVDLVVELAARAAEHPLDELVAGQFMLALHQAGRTADALEHHQRLRKRLVEELGADPSPALQEVHQRILTADPALSLVATGTRPPRVVPAQLSAAPTRFAGRVAQLAELDRALTTAISGTGGIGKTWLALTWAHLNLHRFPDGQLAVDLRGFSPGDPKDATDVLAGFLTALGVDRRHQPQDPDALAALYRSHTAGKRMLVLLDNAAAPDQVVPLLPGGSSCTVLITSRHRLTALLTRHGAHPVNLDVLTDTEARALLSTAIDDGEAITELIGLCGGLPLALGLVAARIRSQPDLLHDLVTELRDLGLAALDSDDPDASLPTVLSWSLRHLTDQQRTLFGLLGIAPGPDTTLPAAAALTGLPPAAARKALSALEEASLLERRPHGRYGMHDLVQEYAATIAHELPGHVREAALTRVMDFHLHTAHAADRLLEPHRQPVELDPPAVQPHPLPDAAAAMAWLQAEYATLLATQRTAISRGDHHTVWHLARTMDTFHLRRGYVHDAIAVWRAALDAAQHLPDPATRSRAFRNLGRAHARLGSYEEAIGHLDQALAVAARHRDVPEHALTHRVLAVIWGERGDDRRAMDHARRALDLYRTIDAPVWEAHALNAVGWHAANLGDFGTAHDHCNAAFALYQRHRDATGEGANQHSLGFIAHGLGDHRQSVAHYLQALTLFRGMGNDYVAAELLDKIGRPHLALGHHDQAREAWREAVELYRRQGRDDAAERVQRQLDDLDGNPLSGTRLNALHGRPPVT